MFKGGRFVTPQIFKTKKNHFPFIQKLGFTKAFLFFKGFHLCVWLMPWMLFEVLENVFKPKHYFLDQRKTKKRKGNKIGGMHMIMVNFDIIIMMPCLSIHTKLFLNQTSLSFCMDCKNISKWSFWCLPTMQKCSQILILKMQSGNLKTEVQSGVDDNICKCDHLLIYASKFIFLSISLFCFDPKRIVLG